MFKAAITFQYFSCFYTLLSMNMLDFTFYQHAKIPIISE